VLIKIAPDSRHVKGSRPIGGRLYCGTVDLSPSAIGARVLRTRWLVRAPIPLFRHRLGWLFGSRVLMLEHVGRTSGEPRFVCLEVVERPSPRRVIVVSGFGTRAQWYRNLRAQPRCHVSVGHARRAPATARFLPEAEADAVLARYAAERPSDWRMLRGMIEKATGRPATRLPMVELAIDGGVSRRSGPALP
jgi:deazaflavin-dependent oxidoreductase (nitroreductase family)